jgi:hypothetical protein
MRLRVTASLKPLFETLNATWAGLGNEDKSFCHTTLKSELWKICPVSKSASMAFLLQSLSAFSNVSLVMFMLLAGYYT